MNEKVITDQEAVAALNKKVKNSGRYATKFVDHTIVYPVPVIRPNGTEEVEIRTFVRAGEYTSPHRWEKAQEIEKQFKQLNKDYTQALRDAKVPEKRIKVKEVANPLKFTPMGD